MTRPEFSRKTKLAAARRAGFPDDFRCECCGLPITATDPPEYDHRVPCEMGGDNSLGNCQVLRESCHAAKYPSDMRTIAKSRSVRTKEAKADRPKRPVPGSRASKWAKRYNRETGHFEAVRREQ